MKDPDFWYLLDWDYDVMVFPTKAEADAALVSYPDMMMFEGRYGELFSGWAGRQQEADA